MMTPSRWGLVLLAAGLVGLFLSLPLHFRPISLAHSKDLPSPTNRTIPGMGSAPQGIPAMNQPPVGNDKNLVRDLNPSGPPTTSLKELPPEIEVIEESFKYDPNGKRDPFRSFIKAVEVRAPTPGPESKSVLTRDKIFQPNENATTEGRAESITSVEADQFSLIGVIWEVKDPKAMLRSPSGKVYTVRQQSRVGRRNGYVGVIREGEVVLIEMSSDGRRPVSRLLTIAK